MRNDFNLMKELAAHTHIGPTPRYQALMEMVNNLNTYIIESIELFLLR